MFFRCLTSERFEVKTKNASSIKTVTMKTFVFACTGTRWYICIFTLEFEYAKLAHSFFFFFGSLFLCLFLSLQPFQLYFIQ